MYEIQTSTIVDHSKRKGLQNSLKGLITVQVNLAMDNKEYKIQFIPDLSCDYGLKFSKEFPGSKEFIEQCYKSNKNPDIIASEIKKTSNIQSQWQRYVSSLT